MDKCISDRLNFPIQFSFQVHQLVCGRFLATISLKNTSSFVLIDWLLNITIASVTSNSNETGKYFFKSIPVKNLSKLTEFDCEMLCSNELSLPMIVQPTLMKWTNTLNNGTAFRLGLDPIVITLWDLIKSFPANDYQKYSISEKRAVSHKRFRDQPDLVVPEAFVYLVCRDTSTPSAFLMWIIRSRDVTTHGTFTGFVTPPNGQCHQLKVNVETYHDLFHIWIDVTDEELHSSLVGQLRIRLLVYGGSVSKHLAASEHVEEVTDKSSVSAKFSTYMSRYRQ
ncbi:hypothetical protein AB6A40_010965 [Gnathostoma spinigerum]|uniref:Uncharacterized protein n=1 Tax=Gnathostoma spinigerum TaxID=75299 RepID=A0ABD6EY38_9BILA